MLDYSSDFYDYENLSTWQYLKKPLFKPYAIRKAMVYATKAAFPFMLFAALFAFVVLLLGNVFPTMEKGLYYVSYITITYYALFYSTVFAYKLAGFYPAISVATLSIYFSFFCTQIAGFKVIEGSNVLGYLGYFFMSLLLCCLIVFFRRICVLVIELFFSVVFFLINKIFKNMEKLKSEILKNLRPQTKNLVFVGDSLIVTGIASYLVFYVISYLYALPLNLIALKLGSILLNLKSTVAQGALIGFAFGIDLGGPITLSIFEPIFNNLLLKNPNAVTLMTIFTSVVITPSWICLFYFLTYKIFKNHPITFVDENLLNTGFINEMFQNIRLTVLAPVSYLLREPETTFFAFVIGSTITGAMGGLFKLTNNSLLTTYIENYGLLRKNNVVYTKNYDAFAGLMPPIYAKSDVHTLIFALLSTLIGALIGYCIFILLKNLKYKRLEKKGLDLFLAYGHPFTKSEWEKSFKEKTYIEKKLENYFNKKGNDEK